MKINRKIYFGMERNMAMDKRNGIDYYAAGIGESTRVGKKIIQSCLAVQRMKHVTTGSHWLLLLNGFYHYSGLGPHLPF